MRTGRPRTVEDEAVAELITKTLARKPKSSHSLLLAGCFCATWRGRVADHFLVVLDGDGRVIGNTLRMYSASISQKAVA